MPVDFSKLTSKVIDDSVKPPPALPKGTYFGQVTKYQFAESVFDKRDANGQQLVGEKEGVVRYSVKLLEAEPSIAEQAGDLSQRLVSKDYSIEPEGLWVARKVWESFGLAVEGRSVAECAPELVGQMCMVEVDQRVDKKDPSKVYNDIKRLSPRPA